MSEKRLYWLKLKDDFFDQKEVKKLRKIAGGDTFTIVYLKLQLLSLKTNGIIEFSCVGEDLSEDLSYAIDEEKENIAMTLAFLQKHCLIEIGINKDILISNIGELTGSESGSAERQRRFRERQSATIALQCNSEVTQVSQDGNTDVTLDNKIEDNKIIRDKIKEDISNDISKKKIFVTPTVEEVIFDFESKGDCKAEAERFYNYYESNGWMVGKNKMKKWQAAVNTWITNKRNNAKPLKPKKEFELTAEKQHEEEQYDFGY